MASALVPVLGLLSSKVRGGDKKGKEGSWRDESVTKNLSLSFEEKNEIKNCFKVEQYYKFAIN